MSNIAKNTQQLRVVIVGHVDHGKSTLIGRLLYDTDSLPDGKFEELQAASKRRGDEIEWSYVLDAFQAERDQAITIDTTQIWFSTAARNYVIIDAPGHREFLKNMISGAAAADAAVLVVDAAEGVREQTKRHAYMLSLLGLKQVAVVVNKMDLIDYDEAKFDALCKDIKSYLASIHITPSFIVPISARKGHMIANRDETLSWYKGKNLIEVLDCFEISAPYTVNPLRFPVQDVYRFDNKKRIIVGRVETGTINKGDTVHFSPTNETAIVTGIETWPKDEGKVMAKAGEVIGVTLDQPIFVERGHMGAHEDSLPMLTNVFRANIFWLSDKPLKVGNTYSVRYGTSNIRVSVQSIDNVVDTQDLGHASETKEVKRNEVAEITLRAKDMISIDPYTDNEKTGRVVLYEGHDIAGGGCVNMQGYPDQRLDAPKSENIYAVTYSVSRDMRASRHGHYGGVFWFTGLSGAGKSTLAMAVEKELFERNFNPYVLDGDNVRHGLNADLGFSPDDRTENIRRVGEVSALQADAGLIVCSAFISPYQEDRDRARKCAPQHFHEIFIKADVATCESRDPKGLYKKARKGEIKEFTGIDSPYEAPSNPELIVDTENNDIQTCVNQVVNYIIENVSADKVSEEASAKQEKSFANG